MTVSVVVGAQWGDEGKGKITDLLSRDVDLVVRYQGGNNAGHTVVIKNDTFKLHLIPSGIFYNNVLCLIGNGVVVDPAVLLNEIQTLQSKGFAVDNLRLSAQAHIIFKYHRLMDQAQEKKLEAGRIGTTSRGIGPCYVDKFNRRGIRVADLYNAKVFREKLEWNVKEKSFMLKEFYGQPAELSVEEIMQEYTGYAHSLKKYIVDDSSSLINEAISQKKNVLLEGAQGTMLDVDHGTYPYVTSSNPVSGGACVGAGVGPTTINQVLGVMKAYVTRVGGGPFPTEIEGELGDKLRERGAEYGATTGRPRRCGWFDGVVMLHAAKVNGLTHVAITKLDVLDQFDEIKICVGYDYQGKKIMTFPSSLEKLAECQPMYETLPGWKSDISKICDYKELPANAKKYVEKIAETAQAKIAMISVGAERGQIIRL